jgi:hypothetical protein
MATTNPPVRTAKTAALVVEAARLQRSAKESLLRIEAIKAELRKEAEKVSKKRESDELVEFESVEGTATVCFVSDSVGLVKGADPRTLRETLSEDVWDVLFQLKAVLAPEFEDKLNALPGLVQRRVKTLLEWKANAPRVTLPK